MLPPKEPTSLPLDESYRPQFHFTPPSGWLNDPNGLVYYRGEYHLFYQHNPDDIVWGPMHWGHSVSRDLVNWQHLPIALYPDELGAIFSGSVVVDWHNTAGFGREALVAIFTHCHPETELQSQSLAHSLDNGRTWTKYAGNPVLPNPGDWPDYRDPKVFWYDEGNEHGHWVMVLTAGDRILFYTSPNLIEWQASGRFGQGASGAEWETPDLFPLSTADCSVRRWVLLVAVTQGAPGGGSGVRVFVGDFDGRTFSAGDGDDPGQWLDHGPDLFAVQTWNEAPDGRRLLIAWMNNWAYRQQTPTSVWRGAMTVPRELWLEETPAGLRVAQRPAAELARLRQGVIMQQAVVVAAGTVLEVARTGRLLELDLVFDVVATTAESFGLRLQTGPDEFTTVSYRPGSQTLSIDRSQSGETAFSEQFIHVCSATLVPQDGRIRWHILLDQSSIELFANGGTLAMTEQIFPSGKGVAVQLFAEGAAVSVERLDLYALRPATLQATVPAN